MALLIGLPDALRFWRATLPTSYASQSLSQIISPSIKSSSLPLLIMPMRSTMLSTQRSNRDAQVSAGKIRVGYRARPTEGAPRRRRECPSERAGLPGMCHRVLARV